MNIFFDTNFLISAFITHGSCADIFQFCLVNHQIYISDTVLKELEKHLIGKFDYSIKEVKEVMDLLKVNTNIVSVPLPRTQISSDRSDDRILAAAEKSCAVFLVSGDNDLLELGRFKQTFIISSKDFWKHVR